MQISDYISGAALIISVGAIYFSWITYKHKQKLASEQKKLASAQKKTELLQKYDERIYKFKRFEDLHKSLAFMFRTDKEFYNFVVKSGGGETINKIFDFIPKIESGNKLISESRNFIAEINVAVNPVFLEERLPHANLMLLDSEHLLKEAEEIAEYFQDLQKVFIKTKIHEGISDNNGEKSD